MDYIAELALRKGLELPVTEQLVEKTEKQIPTPSFGVFVTVIRSKLCELNEWPKNIHGCIGNYNRKYDKQDSKELVKHLGSVSYGAAQTDSRKTYFPNILLDIDAQFEVTFMLYPVFKINSDNGLIEEKKETFNNKKYGILIDSNENQATFLPDVYPDISFDKIKEYLIDKANASKKSNNINYYAYLTKTYKITIANYISRPILKKVKSDTLEKKILDIKQNINQQLDMKNDETYKDTMSNEMKKILDEIILSKVGSMKEQDLAIKFNGLTEIYKFSYSIENFIMMREIEPILIQLITEVLKKKIALIDVLYGILNMRSLTLVKMQRLKNNGKLDIRSKKSEYKIESKDIQNNNIQNQNNNIHEQDGGIDRETRLNNGRKFKNSINAYFKLHPNKKKVIVKTSKHKYRVVKEKDNITIIKLQNKD